MGKERGGHMGNCGANKYNDDNYNNGYYDNDYVNDDYYNEEDPQSDQNTHPLPQDSVSKMMCESLKKLIEKTLRLFV